LTILIKKKKQNNSKSILNKINAFYNKIETIVENNVKIIAIERLIVQIVREKNNIAIQDIANNAISFHFNLIKISIDFRKRLINVYARLIK